MSKYCIHCMAEIGNEVLRCPKCNTSQEVAVPTHRLLPGTILHGRYFVGEALGEGGFGITYIGYDKLFDRRVAIKEYFPRSFVGRNNTVSPDVYKNISEDRHYFVEKGLKKFLDEAKILAKFQKNEGIVSVYDFFEENGTAYIAMEYLNGITLKSFIEKNGRIPAENLIQLLIPLMKTLDEVHKNNLIHRDISPDNIMFVEGVNNIKLLDFGAARDYSGRDGVSMSIMLKPGYAPEEQYRSKGEQGPWTDVYALCATMYKCITGIRPDESNNRVVEDEVKAPSSLGIKINPEIEKVLMKGMSVRAEDRYATVEEMRRGFEKNMGKPEEYTVAVGSDIEASGPEIIKPEITLQEDKQTDTQNQGEDIISTGIKKNKKSKKILLMIAGIVIAAVAVFTNNNESASRIIASRYNSGYIDENGTLWMWGGNGVEVFDTFNVEYVKSPVKMMDDVKMASFNGYNYAVIKSDGSLWELGCYNITDEKIMDDVKKVSTGSGHYAAIKNDGSLWIWGSSNGDGQLGTGDNSSSSTPIKIMDDVKEVSLGSSSSAAIKTDGSLWMWGRNEYENLGTGDDENRNVPVKIMEDVKMVDLEVYHSAAIKTDGSLWMWGSNTCGKLGTGDNDDRSTPVEIMDNVKSVSLGGFCSAAIKTDGSLWMWGENYDGQLGTGDNKSRNSPVKIMDNVKAVAVGYNHSIILKTDGSIWVCGYNKYGQLGTGDDKNRSTPIEISVK